MNSLYRNTPDGLCGNEDCGQMSAWYIFSAMGFYPVNPVGGEYETGVPLFDEVRLHLGNGNTFTVKKHKGCSSIQLNGAPLDGTAITHSDIMDGGTLEFYVNE